MSSYSNMAFKQTVGRTPHNYLAVQSNGYLMYSANGVVQPGTKFAIEHASANLVHIRSSSNNKYWVRLNAGDAKNLIVAQAVEPVVDQASPVCTLFSIRIDSNKRATFYHVQSGRVVGLPLLGGHPTGTLSIDPTATTQAVSAVVDYDGLVILPKFVAFKGSNDLYYKNLVSMFMEKEIGRPDIVCECHYSTDGHLRVRVASDIPGAENFFWSAQKDSTGIAMVTFDHSNPTDVRQMFDVIKVAKNVIALRSHVNNLICIREPSNSFEYGHLVAKSMGMVNHTQLEIVEPVFNRTVTVYEFNLDKARIYGVELLYTDNHTWDNYTDVPQSGTADGRITTSKSHTYTNNVTVSSTVTTEFKTGIPFIVDAKIEVSATASYSHEWAETTTDEQQVGHMFNVVVAPKKRTVARGTATKAKCDVPFAYTQRDYPASGGPPIVTTLHDGVFTGANAYSFHSEVRYDELPTYNGPAPTKCIKRIVPHK
ncbi:uncharacterized protein LOC141602420 [Silene latifolia]|uniref:uncharacterized protein LOC141602420 n=1 Tax=Silene latifolia TaxID=37657 RepID=UPI003D788687